MITRRVNVKACLRKAVAHVARAHEREEYYPEYPYCRALIALAERLESEDAEHLLTLRNLDRAYTALQEAIGIAIAFGADCDLAASERIAELRRIGS